MEAAKNPSPVVSQKVDPDVPSDRLKGLKENWKFDILSGFILFLIALPLSLAIAIASGFPPMAGLFAAILGGMLVSQLSGSYVTINGPAAGLIVVILGCVDRLGGGAQGYHATCAAIVLSGVALTILGLGRAGALGYFAPATVVHGMLAAIGFIIIAKQIPVLLGVLGAPKEPLKTYAAIPDMIANLNPDIAIIGGVGLLILIAFNTIKLPILKKIPAPLVVVAVGIAMGLYFNLEHQHSYLIGGHQYAIDPKKYLVVLPPSVTDAICLPDWSKVATSAFWYSVLAITLIQGTETLLSCAAVDKLDPWKRKADLSKDVAAIGVATTISGMIGGLPMIAEIVRSSANIASGARTRWSNFFHGTFILVFTLLGAALIDLIPQAALAALLIVVGYRLASPKEFKHTFEIGPEQLFLYVVTIVSVLATDLLVGVGTGIACKFILHICNGAPLGPNLFVARTNLQSEGDTHTMHVEGAAIFSNFFSLKRRLDKVPVGKTLIVDLSKVKLIDHSVMEHLTQYQKEYQKAGGKMEITGLHNHKAASKHALASRKLVA